jgi:hypothetical protein
MELYYLKHAKEKIESHTVWETFLIKFVMKNKDTLMKKETQGRGQLTQRVQEAAKRLLGREITVRELRLMPYVQYLMVNEQKLDIEKINQEEREILSYWRKNGYLYGGVGERMEITREFWNILCEIIWLAYVDID